MLEYISWSKSVVSYELSSALHKNHSFSLVYDLDIMTLGLLGQMSFGKRKINLFSHNF